MTQEATIPTAREITRIPVATIANGHTLELVMHTIRGGAGDGPRLGVMADIHGDEPLGVGVAVLLARLGGLRVLGAAGEPDAAVAPGAGPLIPSKEDIRP